MRARTLMIVAGLGLCGAGAAPALAAPGWAEVATKQVAAPAGDILSGVVRLPEPEDLGVVSRSALIPVTLRAGGVWSYPLRGGARAVLLPGEDGAWSAGLVSPDGVARDLAGDLARDLARGEEIGGVTVGAGSGGWIAPGRMFTRVSLPASRARGDGGGWTLRVASEGGARGYVLVEPGGGTELYTYAEGLGALVGAPVVLRSELSNGGVIRAVWADVRSPGGVERRIEGAGGAVSFVPDAPGAYAVRVHVVGADAGGGPVELTTQHVVRAERGAPGFGVAAATVAAGRGLIELWLAPGLDGRRAIVGAEVWGRARGDDGVGAMVPVCWLARVCGSDRSLTLDARWVALAGVDPATLELRRVRAHDVDTMALVAFEPAVLIAGDLGGLVVPAAPEAVTPEMLHGVPGRSGVRVPRGSEAPRAVLPGHRLLLVHGYCSGGNPFSVSDFSGDIAVFGDADANRSHDAFALEILHQTAPMKSFGVAGHSQGGMAALHLSTFYWSGLDWSRGERLIQSVGAPYQGTPLAGNAAVLGDLFGSGCGSNTDMSVSGAAQWLSTIPSASRAGVWYWTTSFEDRAFQFDYCNIVSGLLLSDPDDGVIERSRGQLPGATNMGHREGWCHTGGMRDPAQCTDPSRNAEISLRARR